MKSIAAALLLSALLAAGAGTLQAQSSERPGFRLNPHVPPKPELLTQEKPDATSGPTPSPKTAAAPSSQVASVQVALSRHGYYKGPINGIADGPTQAAIAAYRNDRKLEASGGIDTALLRSLGLI
jgi:hypothetical protein